MVTITPTLQKNIDLIKQIERVVEVTVSEPSDYIEEQIGADSLKLSIFGSGSQIEFFVPKEICMSEGFTVHPQLAIQISAMLIPTIPKMQTMNTIDRFFVEPVEQKIVRLDGAVAIEEYSPEQLNLISRLEAVENILTVTIKRVVDPEILKRVECENAILVKCLTEGFKKPYTFGFVLPESVYTDEATYLEVVINLRQLFESVR